MGRNTLAAGGYPKLGLFEVRGRALAHLEHRCRERPHVHARAVLHTHTARPSARVHAEHRISDMIEIAIRCKKNREKKTHPTQTEAKIDLHLEDALGGHPVGKPHDK
eukprot:365834-Rhodomonas_salina.1